MAMGMINVVVEFITSWTALVIKFTLKTEILQQRHSKLIQRILSLNSSTFQEEIQREAAAHQFIRSM